MTFHLKKLVFACFSFLSFGIVGIGIVLPGWIAFHLGGSQLVGLLLFAASTTGILSAPIAGHIVDGFGKTWVAISGQILRMLGFLLLGLAAMLSHPFSTFFLFASSVVSVFGFALLTGALSGALQALVPQVDRVAFVLRLSIAKQAGIALGTGTAGLLIQQLGSAYTALISAFIALGIVPLILMISSSSRPARPPATFLRSSMEAVRYLLDNANSLSATFSVGLAFAVVQIANLLLPGFVSRSLNGGSNLFGLMEMVAAGAGIAATAIGSFQKVARKIERHFVTLLASTSFALILLSATTSSLSAILAYGLAGMLWSVLRAGADGHLLAVVDTEMIGRVQAFTTLLTACLGMVIFMMPIVFQGATEAALFTACGTAVMLSALGLLLWGKRSKLDARVHR